MRKLYFIVIVRLVEIMVFANCEKSSGFYIDNEYDQTVLHEAPSREQKRDMGRKLLNILELPERPKKIVRRSLTVKRSAPKYLLNIYKNVLTNSIDGPSQKEQEDKEEFDLSVHDISIVHQSDLIMTFGAHNPHSGNASKTNRGKRIWFDVSEVPRMEDIIEAELRLYQGSEGNVGLHEVYTIAIYRVARTKNGGRSKHYIDSTNSTIRKEGWITLNISLALKHWINYPKENRGLFIAVRRANFTGHIMRPDDVGIVGVLGLADKQPFMVGFFKNSIGRKRPEALGRQKRDTKRNMQPFSSPNIPNNPYINPTVKKLRENACNIKTLYISFKDLKWQDWIIAPEGYDANYCSGECNFPLSIRMDATNHAIVQTLLHVMKPHEVPKPCCAPTKLSSVSVLYFLDDSNVVLKKYKNMAVESCGCH